MTEERDTLSLESLEPRVFLSVEPGAVFSPTNGPGVNSLSPAILQTAAAVVGVTLEPEQDAAIDVFEGVASRAVSTPTEVVPVVSEADPEMVVRAPEQSLTSVAGEHNSTSAGPAVSAFPNADTPAFTSPISVWPQQLIQTLHGANGPPATISESVVLPTSVQATGETSPLVTASQLVYLNFDGVLAFLYDGPLRIEGVRVHPFDSPDNLAGQESAIIISILAALSSRFHGAGIEFTITPPAAAVSHSTIYFGASDSFSDYGQFYALSEKVDVGNRDPNDSAFILTNNIPGDGMAAAAYI